MMAFGCLANATPLIGPKRRMRGVLPFHGFFHNKIVHHIPFPDIGHLFPNLPESHGEIGGDGTGIFPVDGQVQRHEPCSRHSRFSPSTVRRANPRRRNRLRTYSLLKTAVPPPYDTPRIRPVHLRQ